MVKRVAIVVVCLAVASGAIAAGITWWDYDNTSSLEDTDEFMVGSSERSGAGLRNITWPDLITAISGEDLGIVQDETPSSANYNGDTTHALSQDDFYDLWSLIDTDMDGDLTNETWFALAGGGDITAIWSGSTGDISALTAGGGDSLDATAADYSIPWVLATDCSAVTTVGRACMDSDDGQLYMGDGADAVNVGPGSYNDLASDGIVVNSSGTPYARTLTGSGLAVASNGDGTAGNPTITVTAASAGTINTGTSDSTAVTPDALAGSILGTQIATLRVIEPDDTLATGDGQFYFTIPYEFNGMNLVNAHAAVYTASSSGTPTVQIYNLTDTVDMLSTEITIDASETNSYTAAAQPVIDTDYDDVAAGDIIRVDVDVAGTGTAGLDVILSFRLP